MLAASTLPAARPAAARPPSVRPRRGAVALRAGLRDPDYWTDVVSLVTPSVTIGVDAGSLAALAIGGVLVLGHSWESIEASRGWKESRAREKAAAAKRTATAAATATATATADVAAKQRTSRTTRAGPMTKEEREAAALDARAERRALLAARRRGGHGAAVSATSSSTAAAAEITVCVNNACAKRGAKDVAAALRALAIAAESDASSSSSKVKVVVKGARCMDACAAGCVLRVNGASGLETFDHVAADEAAIVLELATGAAAAAAAAADAG